MEHRSVHAHRHNCAQTHILGRAEAAGEAETSLLGRQVTNEPEHIVLALEMSRGVKMSPQIAAGHQMSPFHSTPLPPSYFVLISPLSNLPPPLFSFFSNFHPLTSFHHTPLFSSRPSPAHLSSIDKASLSSPKKGRYGKRE